MKRIQDEPRPFLLACLLSQIAWFLSALVLLLIFCAIAVSMEDPDSVTVPFSLCALYLSAFIGGIAAVRLSGDGIASGAVSGCFTMLLVFALTALPLENAPFEFPLSLILTACIVPASVLGAVIGHKKQKNPAKQLKKLHQKKLPG